ncbi:MAG: hypothetical protein GYA51_11855 [Candidatus Methanofastidiosa archaeon]|nr:hypothetical protein [Candidatus Methanofastidiosa archaeon]
MEEEANLDIKKDLNIDRSPMILSSIDRTNENPFFMYSKRVKGDEIEFKKIGDPLSKKNLSKVIDSLLTMGSSNYLTELNLNLNCIDWIKSIFKSYPHFKNDYMKFLLRNFTDSMNTKMKEADKHVIAIMTGNSLLLCHSRIGEKTITPKWNVIERMLDKDNVIRFVSFTNNDEIRVVYYEHERSQFFIDWLGIPNKKIFYEFGGENKFFTEIHGIPLSLEITDEKLEELLKDKTLIIENHKIELKLQIQELPVKKIRRGKKQYKNAGVFLQDFRARYYDLAYYKEQYNSVISPSYN